MSKSKSHKNKSSRNPNKKIIKNIPKSRTESSIIVCDKLCSFCGEVIEGNPKTHYSFDGREQYYHQSCFKLIKQLLY